MDTFLIIIIIALAVAVNVLLTLLVLSNWKIKAFGMMRDMEEMHGQMHAMLNRFSKAFGADETDDVQEDPHGGQPAAGKRQKMKTRQPIGFRPNTAEEADAEN